jgi:hypothetical protein
MSNKKQTPVSWLVSKTELNYYSDNDTILAINQAIEMESQKQQKYDEMLGMLEKIIKEHESDRSSWTTFIKIKQLIKEAKEL